MTVAGTLNLLAWLLSALIAGWLILDMVRVSRTHDEEQLISIPETFDAAPTGEQEGR
jgi:hypothetical protein